MAGPAAVRLDARTRARVLAFLDAIPASGGAPDAVAVFHAVRQLPYLSSGDRSIEAVLEQRAGSCSGKHILLAALLAEIGVSAEVELVEGDFATPLRIARDLPEGLDEAIRDGIPDIHNVVRARIGRTAVLLDATWHDGVKPYGFRVNDGWTGTGDTEVAVDVVRFLGPAADPAFAKAEIIAGWPETVRLKRRQFLEKINAFVERIGKRRDAGDVSLGGDRDEQQQGDQRIHRH